MIITNNPLVRDTYNNAIFIEATAEALLIKARDLVQEGYKIVSYPLPGSIKILSSPVLSVVLYKKNNEIDFEQLRNIEGSLDDLMKNKEKSLSRIGYEEDYQKLDFELLKSALGE